MNLINLLMMEHAVLRVHFLYMRELDRDRIFGIGDFLTNSHAKIEDDVVFPRIVESVPAGSSNRELIERATKKYKDEHELINSFAENMRVWVVEGEASLFREKIGLYIDTVLAHNVDEEVRLFPEWRKVPGESREKALVDARVIIRDFGYDRYHTITGISKEFLDSVS